MNNKTELQQEWAVLHNSYEQYEAYALLIKGLSIVLTFTAISLAFPPLVAVFLLLVLWLQEAIWKTFQSRTEHRILSIETALKQTKDLQAFHFYSAWEQSRPNTFGLISSYLKQALRPTIAFPHIVLIIILFLPVF